MWSVTSHTYEHYIIGLTRQRQYPMWLCKTIRAVRCKDIFWAIKGCSVVVFQSRILPRLSDKRFQYCKKIYYLFSHSDILVSGSITVVRGDNYD